MRYGIILGIAIGALAAATVIDRRKQENDFFKKCKKAVKKKLEDMIPN